MLDNFTLIGYSGHSYVVIETAILSGMKLNGYCEKNQAVSNYYNLTYLGDESSNEFDWGVNKKFFIGIGDNRIRKNIADRVVHKGGKFVNIIHPKATLSQSAQIGKGNLFNSGVTVNALVKIGNQCILNTGCIIEHECMIGDTVHIAPGAVLAGNVTVNDGVFIGANSVIKQGVTIGANATIGAGAVVICDVSNNEVWVGNPAKKIK